MLFYTTEAVVSNSPKTKSHLKWKTNLLKYLLQVLLGHSQRKVTWKVQLPGNWEQFPVHETTYIELKKIVYLQDKSQTEQTKRPICLFARSSIIQARKDTITLGNNSSGIRAYLRIKAQVKKKKIWIEKN